MQDSVATWMTPCIGNWHAKVVKIGILVFQKKADNGFDIADISSAGERQDGVTGIHHSAGC